MSNYRFSSYAIPVKLEDEKDKYMLIHGYTGAIDIASAQLVSKIRSNENIGENHDSLSKETLDALVKRAYLTTKTREEEEDYVRRFAKILHKLV
ncbi:MAG: hypothetical protein LBS03_11455 [Bacteroidales bacterium]|jgi:uncharacterized protein|nr:hypothetical protein [Bacteroidales bacterium]